MKKFGTILLCSLLAIGMAGCSSSQLSSSESTADASISVSASKSAEAKKKADEAAAKLTDAKTTLASKLNDAHDLLDSSNDNVADPQTRVALTDAIDTANAINSNDPQTYTDAVTPLQQTMDAVNSSVEQKKQDDAAAAAAEQKAAEQQAAAKKAADAAAAKQAADAAAAKKAAEQKAAADAAAAQKAQQEQQSQNTYYANCSAVRAAGKAPIYRGQPGYSAKLDRDGDGVGCE
jgi:hypothetical protein